MNFVDRLQSLVDQKGITRNKLLVDLNLGKNSFINWESRGTIPNGETLSKIAQYFNVSVDYLLNGKPSEQKNNPLNAEASNGKDKLEGVHFYTPPAHLRKSNYTPPPSPIEGVWTDIKKSDEPGVAMDDLDREMLSLFQQLPQGERYKLIGRLEALLEKWK